MIPCANCGAKNPAAAAFCSQCLQRFAASAPAAAGAPGYGPPQPPAGARPPAPPSPGYPGRPGYPAHMPPARYYPAYPPPPPPKATAKNQWLPVIVIAVVAGVLIIGSAGFYVLTRTPPGGRAQLSSLAMTVDYPPGWRDRTTDKSFTDDVGCTGAGLAGIPDARCDVIITKGDDSIFVVISARPPSAVSDADLANALELAWKGSKVVEDVAPTTIAGLAAYRAVVEGSTASGLFRRPEPYSFIVADFQTNSRVAFLGAGSRQAKFQRDRPQLEDMIASMEPAI